MPPHLASGHRSFNTVPSAIWMSKRVFKQFAQKKC